MMWSLDMRRAMIAAAMAEWAVAHMDTPEMTVQFQRYCTEAVETFDTMRELLQAVVDNGWGGFNASENVCCTFCNEEERNGVGDVVHTPDCLYLRIQVFLGVTPEVSHGE